MSILMDDIIWTILLIMYDYLFFLFSLDAIDPQLQQLKKEGGGGGEIAIACSWRGHQAERVLAFALLKPTSDAQALYKELW